LGKIYLRRKATFLCHQGRKVLQVDICYDILEGNHEIF
jgi:hypothetical protein